MREVEGSRMRVLGEGKGRKGAGRKAPCLFSRRITHGNNGPVSTHVAGGGERASERTAALKGDFIISY